MLRKNNIRAPLDHIPAEIISARDYELLAPEFILPERYAYISGGSGDDVTAQANLCAYDRYAVYPRTLSDLSQAHTRTELLGRTLMHPLLLAPVAYQTLVYHQGEIATAQAAAATDSCMVTSTLSSRPLEDVAGAAGSERWFQLYLQQDERDTDALIARAVQSGYRALVVTVDASVQAPSSRALRAGFRMPEHIVPVNLQGYRQPDAAQAAPGQSRIFAGYTANTPTREQLRRVIDNSPLPVLIKGVMHPDDALQYQELGAAGIIISNHGGRTIDGVPASLSVLESVRAAAGDAMTLLLDGGIRSGSDAFKAIALGADAVLIGRLQVYALSVAGALGVAHMIRLMREELELTMATSGCATVADIKNAELHIKR